MSDARADVPRPSDEPPASRQEDERLSRRPVMQVGRYVLFDEIASGGFASIHLARTIGVAGFSRVVAVKRLHRQFARDPETSAMFLDEAKVVARIRHPNVLPTLDLIAEEDELFLVMEYVEGVTLKHLMRHARRRQRTIPLGVVLRIMSGVLHGLHGAHEARDERGELLQLIHRDVAPDNILIGVDGMPRLLDFGVARALGQFHSTRDGEVKGKLAYICPEQVRGEPSSRRSDIFSAAAVLWESMTGRRLFKAKTIGAMAHAVLNQRIDPPSAVADTPKKLYGIVMQGLERDADRRWSSASKMASALEAVGELASQNAVGRYVRQAGSDRLTERAREVALVEAFPLGNIKPLPIRSRLDSIAFNDEPTVDTVDGVDTVSEPPPPKHRTPPPVVEGGSSNEEVPALAQQAFFKRRGLVPFVAGAGAVLSILGLVSLFSSDDGTKAVGEPASGQTSAPAEGKAPATQARPETHTDTPTEAPTPPTTAATTQPAVNPPTPVVKPPIAQPASRPQAPVPAPKTPAPAPAPKKSGRDKLWGRK
jgi:serine/threonine-protein kinase